MYGHSFDPIALLAISFRGYCSQFLHNVLISQELSLATSYHYSAAVLLYLLCHMLHEWIPVDFIHYSNMVWTSRTKLDIGSQA